MKRPKKIKLQYAHDGDTMYLDLEVFKATDIDPLLDELEQLKADKKPFPTVEEFKEWYLNRFKHFTDNNYNLTDKNAWRGPHIERDESTDIQLETVTLRDQFAMAALNKLISDNDGLRPDVIANLAYEIADQMMEARK